MLNHQKDVMRRDSRLDQLQRELESERVEKDSVERSLKHQIKELSDRFRVVDETGVGPGGCWR